MKKFSPLQLSRIILAVTLSSMVFLFYIFFIRLQNLNEYSKMVDNTNAFKFKTEQCLSLLKDAESGQRGFMLTNDTVFITLVDSAKGLLHNTLNELEEMAKKFQEDESLVIRFKMAVQEKEEFISNEITNHTSLENFKARKEITMRGKPLMDHTKQIAELLGNNLESKLKLREVMKNQYALITPLFLVILLLVSLSMIIIAWRIIVSELEKRAVMQRELDYHLDSLRRSNAELEQFAYVASHDLQEPLRKIQSFGNLLITKHTDLLDEEGNSMIERMQAAAERMQVLITDLLAYSRVSREKFVTPHKVDLNISLNVVKDLLSEEINTQNVRITSDILPVINGNDTQLLQLFQNLLSNAIKFTKGSTQPEVKIKYLLAGGKEIKRIKPDDHNKKFHKITIRDNGVGFDEQFSEKIFEIFQRLHGVSQYKGSGIGLAICKRIVYNHHGYITATGKVGEGAQFTIYLPE